MWLDVPIKGGSLPPKTLCLTFDDGPGPWTIEIASYLAEAGISATFFAVGRSFLQRPDDIPALLQLDHAVGNHSFSHHHLTSSFLSVAEIVAEVKGREHHEQFFRPPYGAWTPRIAHLLRQHETSNDHRLGPVNWDVGGFDTSWWLNGKSPEACAQAYRRIIDRRKKGIVLFHDHIADLPLPGGPNRTLKLLQILIPQLRDEGYTFAPLSAVPEIQLLLETETPARCAGGPSTSLPATPPGTP